MSALDRIDQAIGFDRWKVVAEMLDELRQGPAAPLTLEDQTKLLDLDELATEWEIGRKALIENICHTLGRNPVIKMSRSKRAIRRVCWLEFLRASEGGEDDV